MTTTIQEFIDDYKETLKTHKLLAELYPDAYLSEIGDDKRRAWKSNRVVVTRLELSGSRIYGYAVLEGRDKSSTSIRVYSPRSLHAEMFFSNLQEMSPAARECLVVAWEGDGRSQGKGGAG